MNCSDETDSTCGLKVKLEKAALGLTWSQSHEVRLQVSLWNAGRKWKYISITSLFLILMFKCPILCLFFFPDSQLSQFLFSFIFHRTCSHPDLIYTIWVFPISYSRLLFWRLFYISFLTQCYLQVDYSDIWKLDYGTYGSKTRRGKYNCFSGYYLCIFMCIYV